MRMYGYLKQPYKMKDTEFIDKFMIHKDKEDVFVYLYPSKDAIFSLNDIYYADVNDAIQDWKSELDEHGWIQIEDPLPYCQHDSILPIRVKGRNIGNPQWGQIEILVEDEWVDWKIES